MYAVTFTKHRISKDMLPELTKEYLGDLGIKLMGDVIAILKHARSFNSEVIVNLPLFYKLNCVHKINIYCKQDAI